MSYSLSLSVENSTIVCLPSWTACVSPAAQRAKQYMHSWARSYSLAINALKHAARVSVRTRSSQAVGMYMMKHYVISLPRGCAMLSLHKCAQGDDAPFFILFTAFSGRPLSSSTYRRSAQLQPVTSACVPASPACACVRLRACALGLSTVTSSTCHKTVCTCLLQVFTHTSIRA